MMRVAFGLAVCGAAFAQCESAPRLAWDRAQEAILRKAAIEPPSPAKQIRTEGTVRIEICVSAAGEVVRTKVVSGPPLVIPAALESLKRWQFRSGAPFQTTAEIAVSQGSTAKEIEHERKINDRFFEEDGKCREEYRRKQYEAALPICKGALELAGQLPQERANERRGAYASVGNVYFGLRQYDEALRQYQAELKIALEMLEEYEAEVADAYHDVALALHALGRMPEAGYHYAMAERTMSQARERIGLEELKPRYTERLRRIREHYLALLRQTRQMTAAAELERRIENDRLR